MATISTISIHAPTRGATDNGAGCGAYVNLFQSTLPREERPRLTSNCCCVLVFQSTLPREERLSIVLFARFLLVFQSTLPREERLHLDSRGHFLCRYFNPRSHERSDDKVRRPSFSSFISIHAPTRGATQVRQSSPLPFPYFNPRSHERSDQIQALPNLSGMRFQSTLPREERPDTLTFGLQAQNFNPRSHERSDAFPMLSLSFPLNFNPRSHERSDLLQHKKHRVHIISIHAPTRGATMSAVCITCST